MARPLLLGHRGARAVKFIPENTLASFDRCLADGCDGFEFDVRLAADEVALICHDPKHHGVEIARAAADQLKDVPTFEQVLERYLEKAFLDIELKVAGLERITAELLKKHAPSRGFVVSSFLPEVLQGLYDIDSKIPLGLICETKNQLRLWSELPVEAVIVEQKLGTSALFRRMKEAGKKVFVWTVNDSRQMRRLASLGAEGVISDDTSLLIRVLAKNDHGD